MVWSLTDIGGNNGRPSGLRSFSLTVWHIPRRCDCRWKAFRDTAPTSAKVKNGTSFARPALVVELYGVRFHGGLHGPIIFVVWLCFQTPATFCRASIGLTRVRLHHDADGAELDHEPVAEPDGACLPLTGKNREVMTSTSHVKLLGPDRSLAPLESVLLKASSPINVAVNGRLQKVTTNGVRSRLAHWARRPSSTT